ncbi:hypothetical protein [Halovenus marina]|uniref:hypothetical protein n=1 Tax=Halovenus marina TaxID=3396621 RepID=UPI003F559A70
MSDDTVDDAPEEHTERDDTEGSSADRDDAADPLSESTEPDESPTDPFERLEADAPDREGDPFERLDPSATSSETEPSEPNSRDQPSESFEPEPDPGTLESGTRSSGDHSGSDTTPPGSAAGDSDTPGAGPDRSVTDFEGGDLDADSFEPAEREGDPFASLEGPFEDTSTDGVDPDAVWETLDRAESVRDTPQRTYDEVSKHSYCEQCEHFSEPPEIHCSHEGTEIVEFPDSETVRVVDCPVVARRRELEGE